MFGLFKNKNKSWKLELLLEDDSQVTWYAIGTDEDDAIGDALYRLRVWRWQAFTENKEGFRVIKNVVGFKITEEVK